jgi:hypothetical protein
MKELIQQKKTIIKLLLPFLTFTVCLIFFSNSASAQSRSTKVARKNIKEENENFQEFVTDWKEIGSITRGSYGVAGGYERKYNIKNGFCKPEDYKIPEKVGILAFYISDDDYSTYTGGAYYSTTTTHKASEEKVNAIAQRIFDQSIDEMKKQYTMMGMELLTPDEFLTSGKLRDIYFKTPLNNMESKAYVVGAEGSGAASPDGFRLLPYNSILLSGKKFNIERDAYLKALGLDAYIIVDVGLIAANGSIKNITSSFLYKNPGYDTSDKVGEYLVGYTPYSIGYVTMKINPPMKGIFVREEQEYTNKKGKTDVRFLKVDVKPGVSVLVNYVVKRLGKQSVDQIVPPAKAGKKKKKRK